MQATWKDRSINESEHVLQGKSLFIFGNRNPLRLIL